MPYLGKLWYRKTQSVFLYSFISHREIKIYENKYNWNIGAKLLNELKTSFFPYILFGYVIALAVSLSKKKREYTGLTPQGSLNWNNTFETTKMTYIHGFIFAFLMDYTRDEGHKCSSSLPIQGIINIYTNIHIWIFIDCSCSIGQF